MPDFDPNRVSRALDLAPWGVMIIRGTRILWANRSLAQTLQSSPEQLIGLTKASAEGSGLAALFDDDSEQLALTLPDGEEHRLQRHREPLNDNGEEAHYFLDVTALHQLESENQQMQDKIRDLDTHDEETGLLNHLAIFQALESQISRSRRYGNPLSAIRLVLEPPSDEAEHHSALKAISQEFKMQLRWADQIGRLDQTAFLLVLPETPVSDAWELAKKLAHDRVALTRCAEGWHIGFAAESWSKGDDARKFLRRLAEQPLSPGL